MKLFEQITAIIQKWYLMLDNDDKRALIQIQDELYQEHANQYDIELKLEKEIDDFEALRMLELKEEKTEEGKKKYTEEQIKAMIQKELSDTKTQLNIAKVVKKKVDWKINTLDKYITALRDKFKQSGS